MKYFTALALVGFILTHPVCAEKRELTCDDSKALTVKASTHGFTRISVKGDKLRDVMGLEEDVVVEKNDAEGILFLKNIKNMHTITLITESGIIQDITLVPGSKETMNIVLKPNVPDAALDTPKNGQFDVPLEPKTLMSSHALTTQERLINLMKQLFAGGGERSKSKRERRSLSGLEAVFARRFETHGLVGEVFTITNTECNTTNLVEKDFYQTGDLALALSHTQVKADETVSLFVIRASA